MRRLYARTMLGNAGAGSRTDFGGAMVNLLKTILGAGMLAMPAAVASLGYVPGTLAIIAAGLLASFGLHLYVESSQMLGREASIAGLSALTYPKLGDVFDGAMALKCAGVALTFLVVIGDMLPGIMRCIGVTGSFLDRRLWIAASLTVLVPLSLQRRLDSLKHTSLVGLVAVGYIVCLSAYHFFTAGLQEGPRGVQPFAPLTLASIRSIPVFVFAFTCHQNIFSVHNEVENPSPRFMARLVNTCIVATGLLYLLFSMLSYADFGDRLESNVFLNYPIDGAPYVVGRLAFTVLAIVSFPLMTHPCRKSLIAILPVSDEAKGKPLVHHGITILIVAAVFCVAWNVRDLHLISSVIGTVAGIPVCYILPYIFYAKLHPPDGVCTDRWQGIKRRGAAALAVFGALAMLLSAICMFL